MKKLILALFALQIISAVYAQNNVTKIEYFFDADNGFGLNNIVAIAPNSDITAPISGTVPAGFSSGFHKLYMRPKADNGKWGQTTRMNVTVIPQDLTNNAILGEYFFDSDPSVAAAFPFSISPQSIDINQSFLAQVLANSTIGYHKLYGRIKDAQGNWSHTFRKNVQVVETDGVIDIVEIESFYGSDLEFGNCSALVLANPQPDGTWIVNLPYPVGNYNITNPNPFLFLRVKDSNGQWSHTTYPDIIDTLLSTTNNFDTKKIAIYPNPTSKDVNINIDEPITSVLIYDVNGRKCDVNLNGEMKTVDVSSLSTGMYLIAIETQSGISKIKFVKN